jgi:hypothetical protein
MAKQPQLPSPELYADLMEEAKARLAILKSMIDGKATIDGAPLSAPILREFGFLQLRMLCEVVALGCLIAHGDIKATQTSKIRDMWKVNKIIAELEKLHPDFYPRAVHFIVGESTTGEQSVTVDHRKTGGLTKVELIALYNRSGEHLHRGSVKKLMSLAPPKYDAMIGSHIMQIAMATNKFVALLETHIISSPDMRKHMLCWLSNSRNQDRVSVFLANR